MQNPTVCRVSLPPVLALTMVNVDTSCILFLNHGTSSSTSILDVTAFDSNSSAPAGSRSHLENDRRVLSFRSEDSSDRLRCTWHKTPIYNDFPETEPTQPFLDIKSNPSWSIASRLPDALTHRGVPIRIIVHPEALRAEYHHLLEVAPKLIDKHSPDAVIHIGLAAERSYFAVERGAHRDGYSTYPDMARKTITKAEAQKLFGKSPERLDSKVDFDTLLRSWKGNLPKNRGNVPDLRLSNDVGLYVCGLVYYSSLEKMWRNGDEDAKVLFFHLPPLNGPTDLDQSEAATLALIKAVAEQCEK